MSHEARHRDIAALLARGVIRVKKQPLVAKAIESNMTSGQSDQPTQPEESAGVRANQDSQEASTSDGLVQHGGDQ